MAIPKNIRGYLEENHVTYWRKARPRAVTSQEIAQLEHIPGRQFAKTVVLKADDRFVMAVLAADRAVCLDRLEAAMGCSRLRLASEGEFARLFPGCETGAMPPFGKLFGLPMVVDRDLSLQGEIEFNAGVHTEVFRMSFSEFELLERPMILD